MSTFSSCPKCAKPITVPRGAEPADMVRCPLCQAEYMLAEALANAPPELLVLRTLGIVSRDERQPESTDVGGTDLHLFDHALPICRTARSSIWEILRSSTTKIWRRSSIRPATTRCRAPRLFEMSSRTGQSRSVLPIATPISMNSPQPTARSWLRPRRAGDGLRHARLCRRRVATHRRRRRRESAHRRGTRAGGSRSGRLWRRSGRCPDSRHARRRDAAR